jgi:hypothetical protein
MPLKNICQLYLYGKNAMLTITLDDTEQRIEIPQSWKEVRLGDYEKWFIQTPSSRIEQINQLAGFLRIEPSILLNSPVQLFNLLAETVGFIFDESPMPPANRITIDGTTYCIASGDQLTLAEWVDMEAVFESNSPSRLSEILAVLCRPEGEIYDSKRCEARRLLFANLTMDNVLPVLAFFLLQNRRLATISSLYLQAGEQAAQYLRLIRAFAGSGDGIKSWQIWRKIKFFFLTRFLQNRLSKFSRSSSTASIKPARKKILENNR